MSFLSAVWPQSCHSRRLAEEQLSRPALRLPVLCAALSSRLRLSASAFAKASADKSARQAVLCFALLAVLCAALSSVLCAAPPPPTATAPLDLGQGLSYVRLRRLPDDLAVLKTAWPSAALVVDARYPAADATPLTALDLPPRPRTAPLLVLVGPGTPPGVLAALRQPAPSLITVGLTAPGLLPDIALDVKPDTDRRAFDALDAGTPLDSLIGEKQAPARFNEAVLAREHENGADASDQAPESGVRSDVAPDGAAPTAPVAAAKPAPPPPLKDAVLERAVQIHRALQALRMLPAR